VRTGCSTTRARRGIQGLERTGIARRGGEIEIKVLYLQANVHHGLTRQPPSLVTSTTATDFSDEEETCTWIWRSSRMERHMMA
jgi:hypothetical protein